MKCNYICVHEKAEMAIICALKSDQKRLSSFFLIFLLVFLPHMPFPNIVANTEVLAVKSLPQAKV